MFSCSLSFPFFSFFSLPLCNLPLSFLSIYLSCFSPVISFSSNVRPLILFAVYIQYILSSLFLNLLRSLVISLPQFSPYIPSLSLPFSILLTPLLYLLCSFAISLPLFPHIFPPYLSPISLSSRLPFYIFYVSSLSPPLPSSFPVPPIFHLFSLSSISFSAFLYIFFFFSLSPCISTSLAGLKMVPATPSFDAGRKLNLRP